MSTQPPLPPDLHDLACRFWEASKGGSKPRIEEWLNRVTPERRAEAFRTLLNTELTFRHKNNLTITDAEYCARFPSLIGSVREQLYATRYVAIPPEARGAGPITALPHVPGFEFIKELGRGGMGVVYKARHRGPTRLVALKMILIG